MNEKSNDKDLDAIPAIAPGKDELGSRRRARAPAPRQSNFNGVLVFSLVLMAIMLGVGGFTLFEVQQRLDQSNELLEQASRGVRDLEDRLAATGTDVSKELQTIKEKQETNFSEIDKLWKVAYRENRASIKELQTNLEALQKADQQLTTSLGGMKTDMARFTTEFQTLSSTMTTVRQNLIDDNNEMTTQVSMVRGQVQDQSVVVEGNRRNLAVIDKKIKSVEEAIDVFDRYRQQVNQRLVELGEQLAISQGGAAAPN